MSLLEILVKLFTFDLKVKIASSTAEKHAIYHLRYQIYVKNMDITFIEHIDHEQQLAYDDADEEEGVCNFYIKSGKEVIGCGRLRLWQPGKMPEKLRYIYDTEIFPKCEQLASGEYSYFLVKKNWRRKFIFIKLLKAAYLQFLIKKIDIVFLNCLPGLTHHYNSMGVSTYTTKLIYYEDAAAVPLVGLPYHLPFLIQEKSFVISDYHQFFAKNPFPPHKKALAEENATIINNRKKHIYYDNDKILPILEDQYNALAETPFIKDISFDELKKLASMILTVDKDQWISLICLGSLPCMINALSKKNLLYPL